MITKDDNGLDSKTDLKIFQKFFLLYLSMVLLRARIVIAK